MYKIFKINKIFLFIILASLGACSQKNRNNCDSRKSLPNDTVQSGPATIFIHGTLPILADIFIHQFDSPIGLVPATCQGNKFLHGRIGYILNQSDPEMFPIDSFYLFGWRGRLCFNDRMKFARNLYLKIRNFSGPITIIGHSHGCNVALNLAQVVQEYNDTKFKVDRLILLACPVLAATEHYVRSDVFKNVISLYSLGDRTQTGDPQKLYKITRDNEKETGIKAPVFSKRFFKPSPNLVQRRVLMDNRNLTHLDFIFKRFLSRLPAVIKLIEDSTKQGLYNDINKEYIINIPQKKCLPPELLVREYCA